MFKLSLSLRQMYFWMAKLAKLIESSIHAIDTAKLFIYSDEFLSIITFYTFWQLINSINKLLLANYYKYYCVKQ